MSADDVIRSLLAKLASKVDGKPTARWGTVTASSPLRVTLDADVDAAGTPVSRPAQSALGALTVGQRVYCLEQSRRVVVVSTGAPHIRGTGVQRAAAAPLYWDFWQDTDDRQYLWVGARNGTWRRFSGEAVVSEAAWDASATSGAVIVAARSADVTIPTVLDATETLLITPTVNGTGFGFIGVASITPGPLSTTVRLRLMQVQSTTTQAYKIAWQICQKGTP